MKHYFSIFANYRIALIILLFHATLYLFLPISSSVAGEINAGDELISLTVKDEPLGDVLYKVAMATGYNISLDNKWQNHRVTASFKEVSLNKGLSRILKGLNSAIIYVSNKKIKIIIYDKSASENASYTSPAEKSLDRESVTQRPPFLPRNERYPLPTSQGIGKEDGSENNELPSENNVISNQESEVGTPDSEGEEKTKPEGIELDRSQETSKDLEGESSDESPEYDNQTESKNE